MRDVAVVVVHAPTTLQNYDYGAVQLQHRRNDDRPRRRRAVKRFSYGKRLIYPAQVYGAQHSRIHTEKIMKPFHGFLCFRLDVNEYYNSTAVVWGLCRTVSATVFALEHTPTPSTHKTVRATHAHASHTNDDARAALPFRFACLHGLVVWGRWLSAYKSRTHTTDCSRVRRQRR